MHGWGEQEVWRRSWFQPQPCQDYIPNIGKVLRKGKSSQESSRWAKRKLRENTAHAGVAEVQNTALITCGRLEKLPQLH